MLFLSLFERYGLGREVWKSLKLLILHILLPPIQINIEMTCIINVSEKLLMNSLFLFRQSCDQRTYWPLTLWRSRVSSPRTKAQSNIHSITTINNIYLLLKILSPSRRNLKYKTQVQVVKQCIWLSLEVLSIKITQFWSSVRLPPLHSVFSVISRPVNVRR